MAMDDYMMMRGQLCIERIAEAMAMRDWQCSWQSFTQYSGAAGVASMVEVVLESPFGGRLEA